jgi:hypothetical protein
MSDDAVETAKVPAGRSLPRKFRGTKYLPAQKNELFVIAKTYFVIHLTAGAIGLIS